MTVEPGARLGPYELASRIGAGGMGEVWRAHDPRIGRDVAIKILPPSFAASAMRLQRFEQEARAAGALNHPNLVTVYDVGVADGQPYLVMELLEGETLRDKAMLPIRKAVDYSVQIAGGLAAAHERGIIHRDLKPENIFVTKDGRVKIVDFGLAKLTAPAEDDATDARTRTRDTSPGTVMGTAGYMSPEQVRGLRVDPRSDIFSFGTILYEMLAGRRAFVGASSVETMNAILSEEPPELHETNPNVSPGLDRVVRRCLEKAPEERFHSAHDVAFALEAVSTSSAHHAAIDAKPVRRMPWLNAALIAIVAALAAFFAGRMLGVRGEREHVPSLQQLTFRRGTLASARFAPDGSIFYSAAWDGGAPKIYEAKRNSPQLNPVVDAEKLLAISSKGELAVLVRAHSVAHFDYEGTLARMTVGAAPRELLEHVRNADFSPDGNELAIVRAVGGGVQLEYPAGHVLYRTGGWIGDLRISPDGNRIAFLDQRTRNDDRGSVAVVDRAGHLNTLSSGWEAEEGIAWTPDGKEVLFSAARQGARFDIYVVDGAGRLRAVHRGLEGAIIRDVDAAGRVLLAGDNDRAHMFLQREGSDAVHDISWLDFDYVRDMSSDGNRIAFSEESESAGNKYRVAVRDVPTNQVVVLGEGITGPISPDGKWVVAADSEKRTITLLPTGAGEAQTIPLHAVGDSAWAPDGSLIFSGLAPSAGCWRYRVATRELRQLNALTMRIDDAVAPDGDTLLVVTPDRRQQLLSLSTGRLRPAAVREDEMLVRWIDARTLLVSDRAPTMHVTRVDVITGARTPFRDIAPPDLAGIIVSGRVVMSSDLKSWAFTVEPRLSDLFLVEGLLH